MPLLILVVGRGERPEEIGPNSHRFRFIRSSQLRDGILSIESVDFVFQHLGSANPEAAIAIADWVGKKYRSRVIGFRGGKISEEWQSKGVALMPDVGDVTALPWAAIPEDFKGDAVELARLLRPESLDLLPAIAILCQGYLAVHAAHRQLAESDSISDALAEMGWDDQKHRSLVRDSILNVQDAGWWLDVLDLRTDQTGTAAQAAKVDPARWGDFVERVAAEWGNGHDKFLNCNFMHRLREARAVSDPTMVAEAYLEIARRLGGRRRNRS